MRFQNHIQNCKIDKMDMKKLLEEYRQVQRTRRFNKLSKKTMAALVQYNKVRFQKGSGPRIQDVTIKIRQGIFPDLGVIVFRKETCHIYTLEERFVFNDKLECEAELKILFENGEDEDISLIFQNKNEKEECVGVLIHYLGLSNRSSPDVMFK